MARTPFAVEVLTPEGSVFKDEVSFVSTRTETGSLGILAGHEPLLGLLAPTELRLYRSDTEIERFAQGEGYVQVADGRVLLLVEELHREDELDVTDLREKLAKSEAALAESESGSAAFERAARDKRRWQAFLAVVEGDSAH